MSVGDFYVVMSMVFFFATVFSVMREPRSFSFWRKVLWLNLIYHATVMGILYIISTALEGVMRV